MSILEDYNITFGVQRIHSKDFKCVGSISPSLDALLFEFRSITSCDSLLRGINLKRTVDKKGKFALETQGLQLVTVAYSKTKIYHDSNKYYSNPSTPPDYTLPTKDFLEILIAWRDFIKAD